MLLIALVFTMVDAPYLQKDKDDLAALWAGTWSNDRHVFFAEQAGMNGDRIGAKREFTLLSPPDEGRGDNSLQSSSFTIDDGSILQTVTVRDRDPCTIRWARDGAQFRGTGSGAGCAALSELPLDQGQPLSLALSEHALWFSGGGREARFRRVRPFTCWAAVLRGAEHGDSGEGMDDWDFRQGVTLHDQGGIALIETDEEPARKVRLQLRDVDWTYGDRRPSLTLYVLGEEDRAISYAWTEGGADRIGINLRWLQASCTADEG